MLPKTRSGMKVLYYNENKVVFRLPGSSMVERSAVNFITIR